MNKKERTVKNWQIHNLTVDRMAKFPGTINRVLTGTVTDDASGRMEIGFHMRSSLIVELTATRVETLNTIYHLEGEQGDPVANSLKMLDNPNATDGDLGERVMDIFY